MLANIFSASCLSRKLFFSRILLVVFAGMLLVGPCASVANALSPDQKKVFQEGILYYDTDTCNSSGSASSSLSTPNVSGETTDPPKAVQQVVWNTLTGGGIDSMHAAAVMGNLAHEGTWDPENSSENPSAPPRSKDPTVTGDGYGYGLMGWTPGQRLLDQMKELGMSKDPPYTAETQAAVILAQIQGKTSDYPASLGQQFLNTKTIEEATGFYEGPGGFENPQDPEATRQDRINSAKQFQQEFGGSTGSASATSSSTASCCPSGNNTVSFGSGTLPNYIKAPYNAILTAAGKKFNVDPAYLVGIFYDENYGYQNAVSAFSSHEYREPPPPYGNGEPWPVSQSAGAEGPFQFIPSTWQEYAYDGNADGKKDPNDIADAAFAAAHLLAANGGSGNLTFAKVERSANAYSGGYPEYPQAAWKIIQTIHGDQGGSPSGTGTAGSPVTTSTSGNGCSGGITADSGSVAAAVQAAQQLSSYKIGYVLGGLHGSGQLDITDPARLKQIGADCSGSVSWVLHQAGMFPGNAGIVSGDFGSWGQAGPGQQMTVWENADHVFIEFNVPGLGHYELNTAYGTANGLTAGQPNPNTPGSTGPGPQFFKWGPSGWNTTSGFTPRHWPGT